MNMTGQSLKQNVGFPAALTQVPGLFLKSGHDHFPQY
jgi:hypothetical protein